MEATVKEEVRERAQDCCEHCGASRSAPGGLDLHHLNGQRGEEHDTPENLRLLCERCHYAAEKRECPICGFCTLPGAMREHLNGHRRHTIGGYLALYVGERLTWKEPVNPRAHPWNWRWRSGVGVLAEVRTETRRAVILKESGEAVRCSTEDAYDWNPTLHLDVFSPAQWKDRELGPPLNRKRAE